MTADKPSPLTLIVSVAVSGSFVGISKLSLNGPVVVGEKRIVTLQSVAGCRVWFVQLPGPEMIPKGAARLLAPAMPPIFRLALPELETVMIRSAKLPSVTLAKSIAVAETVMFGVGAGVPVPLTLIVTVAVSGSFDGILKLSLRIPGAVGE